ncbi:hypothetical protein U1Q18_013692 [Sarracenia purpurea var. burkii]
MPRSTSPETQIMRRKPSSSLTVSTPDFPPLNFRPCNRWMSLLTACTEIADTAPPIGNQKPALLNTVIPFCVEISSHWRPDLFVCSGCSPIPRIAVGICSSRRLPPESHRLPVASDLNPPKQRKPNPRTSFFFSFRRTVPATSDHYLRRLEPVSSGEQDLYAAGCGDDLFSAIDSTSGLRRSTSKIKDQDVLLADNKPRRHPNP